MQFNKRCQHSILADEGYLILRRVLSEKLFCESSSKKCFLLIDDFLQVPLRMRKVASQAR